MAVIYDLADTWADGATTFTSIKMNVTDTASASGSLLMDLQVGGSSKFSVGKSGTVNVATYASFANLQNGGGIRFGTGMTIGSAGTNQFALGDSAGTTRVFMSGSATGYFQVDAGQFVGWGAVAGQPYNSGDTRLYRDAAGTLAQRNSTNAQTFNLYNTYTDASNYERGFMKWNSNVLEIGTEAAGTGSARSLAFNSVNLNLSQPSGGQLFSLSRGGGQNIGFRVNSANVASIEGTSASGAGIQIKESGVNVATVRTNRFECLFPLEVNAAYTVATLPSATVGYMARVTDASAPAVGSTVTGGGAANALCWYNGTNWTVIGV